ncbi:hypothetical protein [Tsukamurella soli]|uniref:Yip1 domain-containing protein n=1 Tax=Tsukamurella soli TaxID=644556 RepID=A0ABP8JZI2_9ACTN
MPTIPLHREPPEDFPREQIADVLKERIYVAFTALTVLVALSAHGEDVGAGEAVWTLVLTVLGTVAAVTVAELIAHIVAHEQLMTRAEWGHSLQVAGGAMTGIVPSVLLLGGAALGWWTTATALHVGTVLLVVWLVGIGFLAARRVSLTFWQQVIVLGAEAVLGVVVVGLKLLAHG